MSGKDRGTGEARGPREPREPRGGAAAPKPKNTGEADTLVGKNLVMGDRAARSKPSDTIPAKKSTKTEKTSVIDSSKQPKTARAVAGQERSLLDADIREEGAVYVPQLKEDRAKYEEILRLVGRLCGDIPHDTLVEVVNEALAVLKSDGLSADLKKKEIQAMFKAEDKDFDRLMVIAKEIKDYRLALQVGKKAGLDQAAITTLDPDKLGAVEDEDDEGLQMTAQADAVDYTGMEDPEFQDDSQADGQNQADGVEEEEAIDLTQIDGDWLAGQLGARLGSPEEGKRREEAILFALGLEDETESQNRLIELFEPALFGFASALHAVRFEVFILTRLGQTAPQKKNQLLDELLNSEGRRLAYHRIKSLLGESDANKLGTKRADRSREDAVALLKEGRQEAESAELLARLPKTVLDLSLLEFSEAGRFMGNQKCALPKGSVMKSLEGYEEVIIPAPARKDLHVPLKKISDLPSWARTAFPRIQELNPIQSTVYECAFRSVNNMLVCAPTGAGKTNIALLTILQQIGEHMDSKGHIDTSRFKVVYIAPMKALVSEIVNSLKERLNGKLCVTQTST